MSTIHNVTIQKLLGEFPNLQTRGFNALVRRLVADTCVESFARVTPDAFAVHEDMREVVAFEVEDAHKINGEKMERLGKWSEFEDDGEPQAPTAPSPPPP